MEFPVPTNSSAGQSSHPDRSRSGARCSGATAAGMGHIVVNDGEPEILKLCLRGREMWRQLLDENVGDRGYWNTGTLWLAEDEEQMALKVPDRLHPQESTATRFRHRFDLEPALNRDLAGGLRIPHDGVVYAPKVTARYVADNGSGITVRYSRDSCRRWVGNSAAARK